jgi:hypothetical protein
MDITETIEITETEPKEKELTSNDRCDSCGAQAYVQVFFEDSDLLFCAHHFKASEEKLVAISSRIYDETYKLDPKRHETAEVVE